MQYTTLQNYSYNMYEVHVTHSRVTAVHEGDMRWVWIDSVYS